MPSKKTEEKIPENSEKPKDDELKGDNPNNNTDKLKEEEKKAPKKMLNQD